MSAQREGAPPRRLMGISHTVWMIVGWTLLIIVVLFPFPWWW